MPYYDSDNGSVNTRLFGSIPKATLNLLLINIIFFVGARINGDFMVGTFAMFYPKSPYFRFWQPLTYMFMHYNFWHIFCNMWGLLMFGSALERTIGTTKYVWLYILSGLAGVACHCAVSAIIGPNLYSPMLGASGAVFGVQIAYGMMFPDAVWTLLFPPIPLKAKWFVLIMIVIELFAGITGTADGIAHFAHLGGALCGFLMILYWRKTGKLWRR